MEVVPYGISNNSVISVTSGLVLYNSSYSSLRCLVKYKSNAAAAAEAGKL